MLLLSRRALHTPAIAYSTGLMVLFTLLVFLPYPLLVYIIALLGRLYRFCSISPSLIILSLLPCVHFIALGTTCRLQNIKPEDHSDKGDIQPTTRISIIQSTTKNTLRTTSVLTRDHCCIPKGVGHDMLLNSVLKYVIKIGCHVLSVVRQPSGVEST